MEQVIQDTAMDPAAPRKTSPAYILAAAAIWALILYSVSSLDRPEPARIALSRAQICLQTP
jgi:hypothetical protein